MTSQWGKKHGQTENDDFQGSIGQNLFYFPLKQFQISGFCWGYFFFYFYFYFYFFFLLIKKVNGVSGSYQADILQKCRLRIFQVAATPPYPRTWTAYPTPVLD